MSGNKVDLTIFVPCYNEERLILKTLDSIREAAAGLPLDYEVLVYDDASTDASARLVADYIRQNRLEDRFSLKVNERNQGVGRNYFNAARAGRGEYMVVFCGDNAEPADAMRKILNLIGKADVIIPYVDTHLFDMRFNSDHRRFSRRLISLLYAFIVRTLSGHNIRYFNSATVHKRENVLKYATDTFGYGYQAELLCRVLDDPATTFLEVKFANNDRTEGKAKAFRLKNIASVCGSLWRILRRRLEWKPPRPGSGAPAPHQR